MLLSELHNCKNKVKCVKQVKVLTLGKDSNKDFLQCRPSEIYNNKPSVAKMLNIE